jgi:7-dehydrocholesterol reductase
MALWYTAVYCDGSFLEFSKYLQTEGIVIGIINVWSAAKISAFSISVLSGYCVFQLLLMRVVPGETFNGPLTVKGNTPVYKNNGLKCYIITMVVFGMMTGYAKFYGYTPTVVYDRFGDLLLTMTLFSAIFCVVLYVKGITAPSSSDSGSSGNFLFDYFWGTELYPRIWGFNVKVFTNCRFGITVWALLVVIHATKSYELHGFVDSMFVSAFLQLLYVTKFFYWETGYMHTIDFIVDRAGFMICWGCLAFVPGYYTTPTMFLVNHPVQLGAPLTLVLLLAGSASIFMNYCADAQRQEVRKTNGNCLVWGKKPEIILATYMLDNGKRGESVLLVSGFWGLARHFNYLPELMLAFSWSVPAGFTHFMPYCYFILLLILLIHRTYRDDQKCAKKYGKFWVEYCQRVPYKIIPRIF